MTTATNPNSRWLFPGRRASQPLDPGTLLMQARRLELANSAMTCDSAGSQTFVIRGLLRAAAEPDGWQNVP
jgi:hypothetical protein